MSESEALLRVSDLATHFSIGGRGRSAHLRAVDGVSFNLDSGKTFGIVGETGSGKSTIARTIMGLERATKGSVEFDGVDLTDLNPREFRPHRKRIQMIFQDPFASLNPRLRIGQIVAEPLLVHDRLSTREAIRRGRELLEQVGLPADAAMRFPHEFSGGQRQRVGIARALASKPDLVIADEPVSALDISIQAQLLNLLKDLQRDLGLSYLFISHDLNVVRYMCDRIGVMYLGRMVEQGPADEILSSPAHPYTQALVSAIPEIDAKTNSERERVVLTGELPSPMDLPSGCRFRTRCPVAIPRCAEVDPPVIQLGRDHEAACLLLDTVPVR